MVITFDQVTFKYVDKYLLNNASFSATDEDKVGVVGINGSGKTTMLKLLLGEEKPKSGKIIVSGNMKIAYLPQEPVFENNISIFDVIKKESTDKNPIEDYHIQTILNKLKLFDHNVLTNHLSGGERKRLALARCLLMHSDMLLLDEPTNHLDQEMIIWLETFLKKWKHGLFMITHDRYFLERVCSKMLELEDGNIYLYEANYSKYLEYKQQRIEKLIHEEKKHKSLYKRELAWMRRGAQARTTKSKSRIERFEALASQKFKDNKSFEFSSLKTYLGKKLLEITNGCKAYADKELFNNFSFKLNRYDRIGVVGPNGCGKSTLFKIIMGIEELSSGEIELGETLKIGYFSQHIELTNENILVIDYIKEVANYIETTDGVVSAKDMLEMFLFEDDKIFGYVKLLSGGEKRRLQLIRVLMQNPNILIMDEPTNDLDLRTLEILENYLEDFFGPILVVSHDRYFLDKVCDTLLVFENGHIQNYQMPYTEFLNRPKETVVENKRKWQKPKRKITTAIKNEYARLLDEINKLEDIIRDYELRISKESTAYMKIMELTAEKSSYEEELNKKMERYFELDELINSEE